MDRRILLTVAFLLLPPAIRAAGDERIDRATLKGLKGVAVVIEVLEPQLEKLGITRDALITRMLGRLHTDGIAIDPGAVEFVALRINAARFNHGPFSVSFSMGLYQQVLLSRNPEVKTSTQTWEVESVLLTDPKQLLNACAEIADELADRFAAAYHSVNSQ
jgi:hypothetical protein